MSPLRTLALVSAVCLAAASQEEPTVSVLATSEGTSFADTTKPLGLGQYSGLLASVLGLSPPTAYTWNGLLPAGLFNRPRTVASIIVEGPLVSFDSAERTYPMSYSDFHGNTNDALAALSGVIDTDPVPALPTLVADVFGARATVVSVSAEAAAAQRAGLSHGDAATHTVTFKTGSTTVFADSATNAPPLPMPESVDWSVFPGAMYDGTSVTVGGVKFSGKDVEMFVELHAMVVVAKALKNHADSYPSVLTFTVTKYAELAVRHGSDSRTTTTAQHVVATTVAKLTSLLNVAYGEKAVVLGVALGTSINRNNIDAVEVARVRRVNADMATSNTSNTSDPYVALAAYAEYPEYFQVDSCSRYKCTCFAAYTAFQDEPEYKEACGTNCYNFSSLTNKSFAVESSNNVAAGCIEIEGGDGDTPGQLCAWDQAACDCSTEAFFTDFGDGVTGIKYLYPARNLGPFQNNSGTNLTIQAKVSLRYAVTRNPNRRMSTDPQCIHCAYGFTLSNGYCYENSAETASGQAALYVFLASTAGLIGMWYVLHQITDGGKWAYLGDVPDVPDMKKTM